MPTLTRGQKVRLSELTSATQLQVRLEFQAAHSFDFSCFGLDEEATLSDDRYFVFYNQKQSPHSEIQLVSFDAKTAAFSLNLAQLPSSVRRLVFVATFDGAGDMSGLETGKITLSDTSGMVGEFSFAGHDFSSEKAIMVAELYFKGEWRLAANGQGFNEGLSAVLKHFGGQEIEESAPTAPASPPVSKPAPVASAVEPPPPPPSASSPTEAAPSVVTLKKPDSTFKIDLNKSVGEIVATAQWIDNGDRRSDNDDLDLRAGILFPDGRMSIVTCTSRGSLENPPYVFHLGDVQNASRAKPGTETIKVNPQIAEKYGGKIAVVFSIYSAIANGPVSIASLKPKIELQYGNQTVKCDLDFSLNKEAEKKYVYTYVIGLAIIGGKQVEIAPGGQVSLPGSEETPWLTWNNAGGVKVTFDGPAVFKDDDEFEDLLNELTSKRYI